MLVYQLPLGVPRIPLWLLPLLLLLLLPRTVVIVVAPLVVVVAAAGLPRFVVDSAVLPEPGIVCCPEGHRGGLCDPRHHRLRRRHARRDHRRGRYGGRHQYSNSSSLSLPHHVDQLRIASCTNAIHKNHIPPARFAGPQRPGSMGRSPDSTPRIPHRMGNVPNLQVSRYKPRTIGSADPLCGAAAPACAAGTESPWKTVDV